MDLDGIESAKGEVTRSADPAGGDLRCWRRPAGSRSALGSEKVRSDARNSLTGLGRGEKSPWISELGFGIGSVGRGGSVGQGETRFRSSACSGRTGLSVVLKIRVSVVRFRPWPPLPTL